MRFRKSEGLNESETILARLCERSFLKLWTYPNLYKKPATELVDLMIVFRNDVLLFSDKSCAYPDTGDTELDWRRWFKRAIGKSAHQVRQAERWLRTHPSQVFLDAKTKERLPLDLPLPADMRVHRICVATGAAERCRRTTGQPMLGIDLTIVDAAAPLRIGTVTEAEGYLHVLDADALSLILSVLDTVSDFVTYLEAKEALINGGRFKGAPTEADMLAYYLHHGSSFPEHDENFVLEPNLWAQIVAQPPFLEGRRLNRTHRTWDRVIEHITGEFLAETLEFGNTITMSDYERVVRIMAGESRLYRRFLSQAIEERADRAQGGWIGSLLPSEQADILYVLLIGPGAPRAEYVAYRNQRMQQLMLRCHAAKAARPAVRFIIGLGLDAMGNERSSEDLVHLDTIAWSDADMAEAERIRSELGYFVDGVMAEKQLVVEEYPGANG
jgi:hypothetical protein